MDDQVLIDAYLTLHNLYGCTSEDILENPNLRADFLGRVWATLGNVAERDLLHRLSYLRKRSRLPRSRELQAG